MLDCAPSISLVGEGVFHAADALLVPVIPATLASRTLRQLVGVLDELDDAPLLLPFLSMVDRRKALHRELVDVAGRRVARAAPHPDPERRDPRAHGPRAGAGGRAGAVERGSHGLPGPVGGGGHAPLARPHPRSVTVGQRPLRKRCWAPCFVSP